MNPNPNSKTANLETSDCGVHLGYADPLYNDKLITGRRDKLKCVERNFVSNNGVSKMFWK